MRLFQFLNTDAETGKYASREAEEDKCQVHRVAE